MHYAENRWAETEVKDLVHYIQSQGKPSLSSKRYSTFCSKSNKCWSNCIPTRNSFIHTPNNFTQNLNNGQTAMSGGHVRLSNRLYKTNNRLSQLANVFILHFIPHDSANSISILLISITMMYVVFMC